MARRAWLAAVVVLAVGCTTGNGPDRDVSPASSSTVAVGVAAAGTSGVDLPADGEWLLERLSATGAAVRVQDRVYADPAFLDSRDAYEVCVDEHTIAVFEFVDEQSQQEQMARIDEQGQFPDGNIDYYGPPRYFGLGAIAVLYQEGDTEFEQILEELLGDSLTPEPSWEAREPVNPACLRPYMDLERFVDSLNTTVGAELVSDPDPVTDGVLFGPGVGLCVRGRPIEVWEYPDVTTRTAQSDRITEGSQVDELTIDWAGAPRFFAAGRILALVVNKGDGDDEVLLDDLEWILGPSITPTATGTPEGPYHDCSQEP